MKIQYQNAGYRNNVFFLLLNERKERRKNKLVCLDGEFNDVIAGRCSNPTHFVYAANDL